MKIGDKREWFESLEDEGHHIPILAEEPELYADLSIYVEAFHALSPSRQVGFAIGPIPYSEITSYLDDRGVWDIEDRSEYRHYINCLDGLYLNHSNQKKDTQNGNPERKR